jgi:hypothetical protein
VVAMAVVAAAVGMAVAEVAAMEAVAAEAMGISQFASLLVKRLSAGLRLQSWGKPG